jgi:hypothetical protein
MTYRHRTSTGRVHGCIDPVQAVFGREVMVIAALSVPAFQRVINLRSSVGVMAYFSVVLAIGAMRALV